MDNRDRIAAAGYEESIVFELPDYDNAIVGVTEDGQVVYDFEKMIQHIMEKDGASREEAIEFIEYNTMRALEYEMAEVRPIIMRSIEDL